jgi:hypothetical protein
MKKISFLLLIAGLLTLSVISCKKDTVVTPPPVFTGLSHNLKGQLKGVLKQDTIYYLTDNVTVKKGDTLTIQPGAIVKATGNYSFNISGNFICVGTDAKPILLTTSFGSPVVGFGYWGGIQADSNALNIQVKFTHINWTGGPAADLSTQAAFDVEGTQAHDYGAKIIIEDNWFFASVDDGIHLAGQIHVSVKRNILQHLGGPDGEAMNIKSGVMGDIAYNYVWAAANSGVKLSTGSSLPQVAMNIFNNTFVNCGWRKVGEFTNAILIDKNAVANIYNNILVGCRNGINVTSKADWANSKVGNNLVYAINDSLFINVFPGKIAASATDVTGSGITKCNTVFTKWDQNVDLVNAVNSDINIPTLSASSPAKAKGATTLVGSTKLSNYYTIVGASSMVLNTDLGAYPSDGSGNKHMPSSAQGAK